jgi:DNA double-strand break repair helicase HerA and related ATPase
MSTEPIVVGRGDQTVLLLPRMANRHGLIAGATGTGKTVTLQVLAEGFSRIGVPVFMADVKGDLSGISQPGAEHPKIAERVARLALQDFRFEGSPVIFWDVFGQQGHPARTTISEMGPLLLGRLLGINDTQQGVLTLAFRVADDQGWLLLDLKDLRSMLQFVGENRATLQSSYGNISTASVGSIQRRLLELEDQGGTRLLGEPALSLDDLLQTGAQGRGVVNILAADKLFQSPKLYSSFLLWLLAELFERLPEVGDRDKPKLVLFFDEAHLLFDDASDALMDQIEQVVRLIRSKGVGVYFVTQSPLDIPDPVLGQLGNRIQHALRAYTPRDQKAVRAAAQTFRPNPGLDTESIITQLGVGEALASTLDDAGRPNVVERVLICPPRGQIGPISADQRRVLVRESVLYGTYEKEVDRESAYEILKARTTQATAAQPGSGSSPARGRGEHAAPRGRESVMEAFTKSTVRAIGSQVGRQIIRGLLGSLLGGRR